MSSPLVEALRRAVEAMPDDTALRMQLAEQLFALGDRLGAVECAAAVLQRDPANSDAIALIAQSAPAQPPPPPAASAPRAARTPSLGSSQGFDWTAAEEEVRDLVEPMFIGADGAAESRASVERPAIRLSDVGGMRAVKDRLEAAFLAPMRNTELRRLYRKNLRGGLLLYGPPGCGKTFIARAVAGELGAHFISIGIADILDPYIGNSERNIREAFQIARQQAPCVLFFDEVDALGQRRSMTRNSALRGAVNQLLSEMDGVGASNDGVFVLAATNQPWDVDTAMRRPGRLDRTIFVEPPDPDAREEIFRFHLRDRPVEGIDVRQLGAASAGFSGADIAYCCELAAEQALLEGVRTGVPRMISMADMTAAVRETRPSIGPWLESARNVVLYADLDGSFRDLRSYLKKSKRL